MTKQDKIGATLRKLDHLWQKRGATFCQSVKELLGGEFKEMTDDEVIEVIKDIEPDKKH